MTTSLIDQAVDEVARSSYGRLVAYLASITSDIAAAEDALSDAFVAALRTWPTHGIPERPTSWLLTAARRSLIGASRHADVVRRNNPTLALLADERAEVSVERFGDHRMELLFTCAHPAIEPAMHAPLMLQTVLGLDAGRIAKAYLIPPATLSQRLVRAKQKIRDARIPFVVPEPRELPDRVSAVLDAIYAAYGSGWDDPLRTDIKRHGLTDEAVRLAEILCVLLPDNAEAHGLAAMLLHSDARSAARRDSNQRFIPLGEQEMGLWSRSHIQRAEEHLVKALSQKNIGPYQLHGAIQSVHNRRALTGSTDWPAIRQLYDGLAAIAPSTGVAVARAAAVLESDGPAAALTALELIDSNDVATYQPYWVVVAEAFERSGLRDQFIRALNKAIELTDDPSVRVHLAERLGSHESARAGC